MPRPRSPLDHGLDPAGGFLARYASLAAEEPHVYWLLMDAVGFLPSPGMDPLFGSQAQLQRLDQWLHELIGRTR